jgi:hypothetical protein
MVPRPEAPSFVHRRPLEQPSLQAPAGLLRGHKHSIAHRLVADLTAFMPLPPVIDPAPGDGAGRSMALVRTH